MDHGCGDDENLCTALRNAPALYINEAWGSVLHYAVMAEECQAASGPARGSQGGVRKSSHRNIAEVSPYKDRAWKEEVKDWFTRGVRTAYYSHLKTKTM